MAFERGVSRTTNPAPPGPRKVYRMGHEFAQALIDDPLYRESVIRRIKTDSLPPAIEALLWFYAFGKPQPRETYDVIEQNTLNNPDLSQIQKDELIARARLLVAQIEGLGDRRFLNGNPCVANPGDSGSIQKFSTEVEALREEIDVTPKQPGHLLEFPKDSDLPKGDE